MNELEYVDFDEDPPLEEEFSREAVRHERMLREQRRREFIEDRDED